MLLISIGLHSFSLYVGYKGARASNYAHLITRDTFYQELATQDIVVVKRLLENLKGESTTVEYSIMSSKSVVTEIDSSERLTMLLDQFIDEFRLSDFQPDTPAE